MAEFEKQNRGQRKIGERVGAGRVTDLNKTKEVSPLRFQSIEECIVGKVGDSKVEKDEDPVRS